MRIPFTGLTISRSAPAEERAEKSAGKPVEAREGHINSATDADRILKELFGVGVSNLSGVTVTVETALGAATVFACVRTLASSISSLPFRVVKMDEQGTPIFAPEHPLNEVLGVEPNPFMTPANVFGALEVWLALAGKAFFEVVRGADKAPAAIYPVANPRMQVDVKAGQVVYFLDGASIDRRNVAHFRGLTFDGLTGISPTGKVKEAIALALVLQENAAVFFGNGSRPGMILEHPGSLSKPAQERLRDSVDAQATGNERYRTIILEEGMKANLVRSENTDSQFLESRDRQDLEICRAFGVPPHKAGIPGAQPRANIEQENLSYVIDTVGPICTSIEQELTRVMLSPIERAAGYRIGCNLAALLRGDLKSRYEAYATARQWGWLSLNDVRRLEGLPPVTGGDRYLSPLNMGDAAADPADAPAKAEKTTNAPADTPAQT